MDGARFYLPGIVYTKLLDVPLRGIRRGVSRVVLGSGYFPLLDLCCGPGTQTASLSPQGETVLGLDINLKMLKYAASSHRQVPFICADAAQTPLFPGAFRGVVVSFALHEKEAALRSRLLEEAARVLAPGGRIVLVDFERPWDAASRLASIYVSVIERLAGRRHFRNGRDFLKRGGLRAVLKENGLREVERRDIAAGTCAIVIAVPDRPGESLSSSGGPQELR
jgi:ubiquinone/menaquinone biosynthesis C-methylase UbiE